MGQLTDNVRIILDNNWVKENEERLTENNWEIIPVNTLQTAIFPINADEPDENGEKKEWRPNQLDAAIYFKTIAQANGDLTCPSFLKPKDYIFQTENGKSGICNYSSGFITSRGSIMPRIIFPTDLFIQNGIVFNTEFDKESGNPNFTVDTSFGNCFNWTITIKDGGETFNPFDKINSYGEIIVTEENFSFVNTSSCSDVIEKDKIMNRVYRLVDGEKDLSSFIYSLPDNYIPDDLEKEPYIGGSEGKGGAFAICYNYSGANTNDNNETEDEEKYTPTIKISHGENIEFFIPNTGKIGATINDNISTGTITPVENTLKMGQMLEKTFKGNMVLFYPVWNGIAVSAGISDAETYDSKTGMTSVIDQGFIAFKNPDVQMSDFCNPLQSEYDTQNPSSIEVEEKNSENSVKIEWNNNICLSMFNCFGSFAYMPVFFQKKLSFSVFIRDDSGANIISMESVNPTELSDELTYDHYMYPIYYDNDSGYTKPNKVIGKKLVLKESDGTDKEEQVYYRFDFNFNSDKYQRRGIEIFGFIHQTKTRHKPRTIDNDNGRIKDLDSSNNGAVKKFNSNHPNYNSVIVNEEIHGGEEQGWIKYATSINVNRSSDQTGGQIVLDKYAFIGQFDKIPQPVGEVRLRALGGNTKAYKMGSGEGSNGGEGSDVFFTGIGFGIGHSDSSNSDTMDLTLHGIEKKLQDIKLINAPFFDGDPVGDVADYLAAFANIQIDFYTKGGSGPSWMEGRNAPLPRSSEFSSPNVNFQLGMPVFEAFNEICEKTNKLCFFDRFGTLIIMDQNIYGVPIKVASALNSGNADWNLDSEQIISVNLQPNFTNVYNQILTAGLRGTRKGGMTPFFDTENPVPLIEYSEVAKESIEIPWSRFIVSNENGFFTRSEIQRIHSVNKCQFTHYQLSGSLTIPGNAEIELFDSVKIDNNEDFFFYVTNINHNYQSSTRVWTTSLQLGWIDRSFGDTRLTLFTRE